MTETEKPDPQVVAALTDVVTERGWVLTSDGGNGVYSAELLGVTIDPMVASASPDGLVRAMNSYEARIAATKPGFLRGEPTTIITGIVEEEDMKP